jgi:hypothetical protein
MGEEIDYKHYRKCEQQVSREMLASGWHTYDGKFNQVLKHRSGLRYRGVK